MFKYTEEPHIASTGYVSKMTEGGGDQKHDFATPHVLDSTGAFPEYEPGETNLRLPARDAGDQEHLLDCIVPRVILFLRKVRRMHLKFEMPSRSGAGILERTGEHNGTVEILRQEGADVQRERFIARGEFFPAPECHEERRKKCAETRVALAFPRNGVRFRILVVTMRRTLGLLYLLCMGRAAQLCCVPAQLCCCDPLCVAEVHWGTTLACHLVVVKKPASQS